MLLLNKGWKRRLLEVVEAIYKKNTCYLRTEEHREIGCEFRENTGNLILTRTRPPCFTSKNLKVRKWKKNKNNMTSGSGGGGATGAMAPLALLKLVKKRWPPCVVTSFGTSHVPPHLDKFLDPLVNILD